MKKRTALKAATYPEDLAKGGMERADCWLCGCQSARQIRTAAADLLARLCGPHQGGWEEVLIVK